MNDDDMFEEVDHQKAEPVKPLHGEIARGFGWILTFLNGTYLLHYQRGGMAGGDGRVEVPQGEARGLVDGQLALDSVLIAHDLT